MKSFLSIALALFLALVAIAPATAKNCNRHPWQCPPPPTSTWSSVFRDDFNTWDSSRYNLYQPTWPDTEEQLNGNGGFYTPSNISASGGALNVRMYTDNTGTPRVAAFVPRVNPDGTTALLSMRTEIRIRADLMPGYKGVPLYWPKSGVWPRDGEINWPEGGYEHEPVAFLHHQGATCGCDQEMFRSLPGTKWQDWHTYTVEWIAGVSAKFYQDGTLIGSSTTRIPNTPMHWVIQLETAIDGKLPDPSVNGFVNIDYLQVWKRT